MKVALVSQNVNPGLLVFRLQLIKFLVSMGHDVFCFATDFDEKNKNNVKDLGAIPIQYTLNKAGLNPFSDLKSIIDLYVKFKENDIDLVLSFFIKPSLYASLAGAFSGVKKRYAMIEGLGYLYTKDSNGLSLKKRLLQSFHSFLASVCYFFANKVIFLNQDDLSDLRRKAFIAKDKCFVLGPIGIELEDDFSELIIEDKIVFLFVGRILKEKGILEFVKAANSMVCKYSNVEFLILGGFDDNPSSISSDYFNSLIKNDRIKYIGYTDDMEKFYKSSHVFVLPSYREGFPRSTQEAMSFGLPVITTDVPGCRETIKDNGILISPFCSLELYKAMEYFVLNPNKIKQMGNKSFIFAKENFDVKKKNSELCKILGLI